MTMNIQERIKKIKEEIASVEKQLSDEAEFGGNRAASLKEKLRRLGCDLYMAKVCA